MVLLFNLISNANKTKALFLRLNRLFETLSWKTSAGHKLNAWTLFEVPSYSCQGINFIASKISVARSIHGQAELPVRQNLQAMRVFFACTKHWDTCLTYIIQTMRKTCNVYISKFKLRRRLAWRCHEVSFKNSEIIGFHQNFCKCTCTILNSSEREAGSYGVFAPSSSLLIRFKILGAKFHPLLYVARLCFCTTYPPLIAMNSCQSICRPRDITDWKFETIAFIATDHQSSCVFAI